MQGMEGLLTLISSVWFVLKTEQGKIALGYASVLDAMWLLAGSSRCGGQP